jgi:hypothetical protein
MECSRAPKPEPDQCSEQETRLINLSRCFNEAMDKLMKYTPTGLFEREDFNEALNEVEEAGTYIDGMLMRIHDGCLDPCVLDAVDTAFREVCKNYVWKPPNGF